MSQIEKNADRIVREVVWLAEHECFDDLADEIKALYAAQRAEIARLRAENEIRRRSVDAWVPCPDHRDKRDGVNEGCVVCEVARLRAENERLRAALEWCGGSPDFNEGGQAEEGWRRLCTPLLADQGDGDDQA